MNTIHKERLLNVAKALRDAAAVKAPFDMDRVLVSHSNDREGCGTPACAFGHYAAREDLQQEFKIKVVGIASDWWDICSSGGNIVEFYDPELGRHFGITETEQDKIFGGEGCGNAQTPIEAAEFIEAFVKSKQTEENK